jgi:hypothetical protein
VLTALKNLPEQFETDPERIAERHREKEVARERLARLVERSARIRRHIEEAVRAYNGEPGKPDSFDLLHDLLEEQAYRLAYWRTAAHEINYRRFFDINDLAGIRMEDPEAFAATHALVARLIAENAVQEMRIDHPDGLYDPAQYFRRVQARAARVRKSGSPEVRKSDEGPSDPRTFGRSDHVDLARRRLHLVAEKVLSAGEALPADWAISGTTGYNFCNELNGVFVDASNARALRRIYRRVTRQMATFDEVVYQCKKLITRTSLASELNVLAHALNRISEGNRRSRDFTLNSLRDVLGEVVACFPVYRSYVNERGWTPSDRAVIETAVRRARRRNPALEPSAWDFLREVLLPRQASDEGRDDPDTGVERRVNYPPPDAEEYRKRLHFAMRFQQYTAPVQAKGVEDTAFYRYNLLLSLNEVGGEPGPRRAIGGGIPRGQPRAAREVAARNDVDRHARHEAGRGRPRAHQRDLGTGGRLAPGRREVDADQWRQPHEAGCGAGARPQRRVPLLPGAPRHLARRSVQRPQRAKPFSGFCVRNVQSTRSRLRPSRARLHDQSHQGGQAPHELDQRQPGTRQRRRALRRAHAHRADLPPFPLGVPSLRPSRRASRDDQFSLAAGAEDRFARRPGLLPGHGTVGSAPGGPRQPPAGRLRAAHEVPRGASPLAR